MRDNFFHKNLGPVANLGEGVEAWTGYHSSVRPTGLGLTLNLGTCLFFPSTFLNDYFVPLSYCRPFSQVFRCCPVSRALVASVLSLLLKCRFTGWSLLIGSWSLLLIQSTTLEAESCTVQRIMYVLCLGSVSALEFWFFYLWHITLTSVFDVLDLTMTTIFKAILVEDFLCEKFNARNLCALQKRDWTKAKGILKNVRVETTHMAVSRTHKISGFSELPIGVLK